MEPETLPLLNKEILAVCPRSRVLVVGKVSGLALNGQRTSDEVSVQSGVGKSSLISHAFGIDIKSISHQEAGKCDINFEIISQQNPLFVLHDSMGFEHGDMENLETAKNFLQSHVGKDVALQTKVHVIWLCIQVPYAGGRVFETGDEEFLKLACAIKVPVVVVFTQFDMLVDSMFQDLDLPHDASEDTIEKLCNEKAERQYQELCVGPLRQVNPELRHARSAGLGENAQPDRQALNHLIQVTRDLVEKGVEGDAWIVTAMAQRTSSQVKIDGAIAVGMKRYWRGLASSTIFSGSRLIKCLDTVHEEMTDSWNFHDPDDLLLRDEFREKIKRLAQLVTPDDEKAKSLFGNTDAIKSLLGMGGPAATTAAAPVIVAIGLTAWFIKFLTDVYSKTPEALRCFMGYIIDLTLVLNELFSVVRDNPLPQRVTNADIDKALENYNHSHLGCVHRDIRQYVRDASFWKILQSNKAEIKVKELLNKYSSKHNQRESGS
ncbi:G domain-containing protein [Mycena venus]|uniref:G domain-containing protein n=1 Tax=Mycena venus TaxID=2733690 RepID=A0A8H6U434_9AGAR|nr:G domain-containing protein [Mycena venus]